MAEPEPVPVRDLEVADRIAKAVRGGKPADRTPTIEQLVAAFGEAEPTLEARRRAARALALAGVAAVPDVLEAAPGQRLTLEVRHVRRRRALVGGILALAPALRRGGRGGHPARLQRRQRGLQPAGRLHRDGAHDGHQHGDAGADLERHDGHRTTATGTTAAPTTSTATTAGHRVRPPARQAPAPAPRPREGGQGPSRQGPRRRQAARHRAPERLGRDLPVRRGRRQAALQRHPHRRAHLPRARPAPQHRPGPEHAPDRQRQGRAADREPHRAAS